MRCLSHINTIPLIGVLQLPGMICLVSEYCVRGSVADLLFHQEVAMDADFKQTLVQDIVAVLCTEDCQQEFY